VITARLYTPDGAQDIPDPAAVSDVLSSGRLVWMDLSDATDVDLETVAEEFSLHPLAIEDARHHQQRPKIERYPTHAFVVAYSKDLSEVDIFIGPNWIVTVSDGAPNAAFMAIVRKRFERTRDASCSSGLLLYTILDELVDGYFEILDDAEQELERTEELIFNPRPSEVDEVQAALLRMRRTALEFRRRIVPLREVLSALLRKEVPWIDDVVLVNLQDVFDHVLRAIDQVDTNRELIGNAVDAHLASVSNQLNQVMKQMTAGGSMVLGASLIAGIYGMNFHSIPELSWTYGYPYALILMLVLSLGLFVFFKRRGWL
jgi:magnesium transporter